jgi:antitoxin component YwqK of YwqJK toxin-antitoxin module
MNIKSGTKRFGVVVSVLWVVWVFGISVGGIRSEGDLVFSLGLGVGGLLLFWLFFYLLGWILSGLIGSDKEIELTRTYCGSGKLKGEFHYTNGEKVLVTICDESGGKKSEFHYKNGKEDEMAITWNKFGAKEMVEHYKNGEKVLETSWYKSGNKKRETHFNNGRSELSTCWEESGDKMVETHEGPLNEELIPSFIISCWYQFGEKETEEHYKDGDLFSKTLFHDNGVNKITEHFKDGILNGLRTEWDEEGNIICEKNFVDGNEK